jgi:hypothetical protein
MNAPFYRMSKTTHDKMSNSFDPYVVPSRAVVYICLVKLGKGTLCNKQCRHFVVKTLMILFDISDSATKSKDGGILCTSFKL